MKMLHVVGARPNFMKAAPVIRAFAAHKVPQLLVHTGQHYDKKMSDVFFEQLELPKPDINLEVGSASHAVQTAEIMKRFEAVVLEHKPDWVLVYGDVNSTVAASLVCAKLGIRTAHVEAGLRSRDRTMPEELNRLVTDQLSDLLLAPSPDGVENLLAEGVPKERTAFVGNVMIDTLVRLLPKATPPDTVAVPERYALVTLHRPANVDDAVMLRAIFDALENVSKRLPILFPIHPRTRARLGQFGIDPTQHKNITLLDPLGYLQFLALQRDATVVVTDSGGIQEETTYMGVPCLTLRPNTERPVTVTEGTNLLLGSDFARLQQEVDTILDGGWKQGKIPDLWDGKASERIAELMVGMG